jgi:hypothetical protein
MVRHHLDRDTQGVSLTKNDIADRVANEQELGTGCINKAS